MDDADFRDLVYKMRTLQQEYFRTRDPGLLRSCKDYERRVDIELRPKHPQLFKGGS